MERMNLAQRGWAKARYLLAGRKARRHNLAGPFDVWKMKRDYQISFLKEQGMRPEHHLLDLGCGTLRGGIPMIEYLEEGHYVGVDVREHALEEARKELAESGLEHKNPTIHLTTDLSREDFGRRFDVIWAFSVIMQLEEEVLRGALEFLSRHLADEGRFMANAELGPLDESGTWDEFPNVVRPLEYYQQEAAAFGMKVGDLGTLSSLGHPPDKVNAHHHMLVFTRA